MCALNICQQQYIYSKMIDLWRVPCLKSTFDKNTNKAIYTWKHYINSVPLDLRACIFEKEHIYLLGNPKNVFWNPQKRDHFFQMTCLHLLWKMNMFPSIYLETPKLCIETLPENLLSKTRFENMPCLLSKWMFSNIYLIGHTA